MEIQQIVERTQAVNMFWDREIDKFLKLKPSSVVKPDETVSPQDQAQNKAGVSVTEVNTIWKDWVDGYKELVRLAKDTAKDNAREELNQIYGITLPKAGL